MSQSPSNADRIRAIYAAFGAGNVPAILEHVSEAVEWEYSNPGAGSVPWLQPRRGRQGAAAFFASLGALEFRKFNPHTIVAGENVVLALVDVEFVVKATGRVIREENEIHVFHCDERGQVIRMRHGVDTAAHVAACAA